jgi:hypothetical protein
MTSMAIMPTRANAGNDVEKYRFTNFTFPFAFADETSRDKASGIPNVAIVSISAYTLYVAWKKPAPASSNMLKIGIL